MSGSKGNQGGGHFQTSRYCRAANRVRQAARAKRSPIRRLWQAEKTSQGIRRYQAEHRQHFAAAKRAGTGKRNGTGIKKE